MDYQKRALSPTEADGGAASNGGQWTSDLPSPLLNQQLWEKREREQAQELQLRNLKHQVGQFQQRIQLDHLERGLVGANSPIGNAAPPPCDSRERQPSLAAGSLGAPENPRERQLSAAAGSLEVPEDLGAASPASGNTSAAHTPPTSWKGPKMQPYKEGEDIEVYLATFERIALACRCPQDDWALHLVPLLTEKARAAYIAMDIGLAMQYRDVKAAILQKFEINPETYRDRFRSSRVEAGDTPRELQTRLKELYEKWMIPRSKSKEEIGDAIVMEQFLRVLNPELRTWIKEHNPATSQAAAELAETFMAARRSSKGYQMGRSTTTHLSSAGNSNPRGGSVSGSKNFDKSRDAGPLRHDPPAKKPFKRDPPVCYNCGEPGHIKPECPLNAGTQMAK